VSARPPHHVDTGTTPEALAHRRGDGPPVGCWVGLGDEAPIPFGARVASHPPGSLTSGTSSVPSASSSNTATFGFSASRRANTEPEDPDPQTMKS
jgi:hypothetical protein